MVKDPAARYPDMEALADALEALAGAEADEPRSARAAEERRPEQVTLRGDERGEARFGAGPAPPDHPKRLRRPLLYAALGLAAALVAFLARLGLHSVSAGPAPAERVPTPGSISATFGGALGGAPTTPIPSIPPFRGMSVRERPNGRVAGGLPVGAGSGFAGAGSSGVQSAVAKSSTSGQTEAG